MTAEQTPNEATFMASRRLEQVLLSHHKIYMALSGGADSDIMLDLFTRVLQEKAYNYDLEIHYVFFDTGIEYSATKRHLDDLEQKYGITIERIKAKTVVPIGCAKFGVPFISKYVSEMIDRLQNHNFDFENDGRKCFEELMSKYNDLETALKWWCNANPPSKNGKKSSYSIKRNAYLKEFMLKSPPRFKISRQCCVGAKEENANDYCSENNMDLCMLGLRQAENGVRSTNISSCFTQGDDGLDNFRLIWWFSDKDKQEYKKYYNIQHSDCYEVYGLKRTGCAGCPFGSKWEYELKIIEQYEPKLYKAVTNIFAKSYEYTRLYRKYAQRRKQGIIDGQISLFDSIGSNYG